MEVPYEALEESDFFVDCVYKAGSQPNLAGEVISRLIPGSTNLGGFRKIFNQRYKGKDKKIAYVVLYTSLCELAWPDYLDVETGILRYYGDNRKAGRPLLETPGKGNLLLQRVFRQLHSGDRSEIPPFLIFKREGTGRDMRFLGLAVPGASNLSPDRELKANWNTINGDRFQNYEAYFTILDTGSQSVSKAWLQALWLGDPDSLRLAPQAWRDFVREGKPGLHPLKAPRLSGFPSPFDQLQSDMEGLKCLSLIREHFRDDPLGFECCAADIVAKLDPHFADFTLTRSWQDGGRDTGASYRITTGGTVHPDVEMSCAIEARCYAEKKGVGKSEMDRLIARSRNRQLGVMVTTSFITEPAYKEAIQYRHRILMLTATDIARILRENSITSENIESWFDTLKTQYLHVIP